MKKHLPSIKRRVLFCCRAVGGGHARPGGFLLSHANGLDCRGGIYAARDACADGNSAGRIYAAPTNLPANGFLPLCRGPGMPGPYREAVRRGGIYAARDACADGNVPGGMNASPTNLPANGFLPLCRGPGMPGPYGPAQKLPARPRNLGIGAPALQVGGG